MTLAGIATMRSVDTATITAGNIGLRQASVNAADQGLQAGVNWLTANLGPILANDNHQPERPRRVTFPASPRATPTGTIRSTGTSGAVEQRQPRRRRQRGVLPHPPHVRHTQLRHQRDLRRQTQHLRVDAFHIGPGPARLGPDPPTDSHSTAPAIHYRVTAKAVGPRNSISIVQSLVRAFN